MLRVAGSQPLDQASAYETGSLMSSHKISDNGVAPDRIYSNQGNEPLIALLDDDCNRLLDIGCGAGDNATLIKSRHQKCAVFGITHSAAEAELARQKMTQCWVFDIEHTFPTDLAQQTFDTLVFSHVLEHLRNPATVLARFLPLLRNGGQVLIAVPNILSWRTRLKFLRGNFEYESTGALDDTHLRFFTYFTADQYLLAESPTLEITTKKAHGSVPLYWLRRHVLPLRWSQSIDMWGCRNWPNLFGNEIFIKAVKR